MTRRTAANEEPWSTRLERENNRRRHWNQLLDLGYIVGAVGLTAFGLWVILEIVGKHQ